MLGSLSSFFLTVTCWILVNPLALLSCLVFQLIEDKTNHTFPCVSAVAMRFFFFKIMYKYIKYKYKYRKSYKCACISCFMGHKWCFESSQNCTSDRQMHFWNFQKITSDHKPRNVQTVQTIFCLLYFQQHYFHTTWNTSIPVSKMLTHFIWTTQYYYKLVTGKPSLASNLLCQKYLNFHSNREYRVQYKSL